MRTAGAPGPRVVARRAPRRDPPDCRHLMVPGAGVKAPGGGAKPPIDGGGAASEGGAARAVLGRGRLFGGAGFGGGAAGRNAANTGLGSRRAVEPDDPKIPDSGVSGRTGTVCGK